MNLTRPIWIALTGVLIAAGAVVSMNAPASAAAQTRVAQLQHATEVRAQLLSLIQAGADDRQIKAELGLINITDNMSDGTVEPLSENGSVTIPRPSIYYDTQLHEYYVAGTFSWNNQQTNGDCGYCSGNVGGYDGLGIRLNQDVNNLGVSMSGCPGNWYGATPYPTSKPFGCIAPSNPWDNDDAGATFKYQDKSAHAYCSGSDAPSCGIYDATTGTIAMTFTGFSGCLHAYSTYLHTWSSTQISSFDVSKTDFGVSFSSSSHGWQATSQSGSYGC